MRAVFSLKGELSQPLYALLAPILILMQHLVVALAAKALGQTPNYDIGFWLLALRRLAFLAGFAPWATALSLVFSLAVAWALAVLSFQRASRARGGYALAALSIVPGVQILSVILLALLPDRPAAPTLEQKTGANVAHILQGVFAGSAIIVLAVLVSAVTFGTYGWGLFVATPFLVGVITAYLANRDSALTFKQTALLVVLAAGLGTLALVMLALEGIVCIALAAPLGALVAMAGGALGRMAALKGRNQGRPLTSIVFLPAVFFVESVVPPALPIAMHETIDIAAPPTAVWQALTSDEPIAAPPGLVAYAGLAYPIRGRIIGEGVGAQRIGEFSTGLAWEQVTAWEPDRKLTFTVLIQPPIMKEISPYRHVHAPHVSGYFETSTTSFELQPLANGATRLTARAAHMLRMDPVFYWEPMARWAIHANVTRVLQDIKQKAETAPH